MRRTLAAVAALAVLATGCSGVPTSSKPQVIGPVQGGPAEPVTPTITPQPGADARAIVQEFLRANVSDPVDRGAHEFLTPEEQRKWSDQTVTILAGSVDNAEVQTGDTSADNAEIPVSGTQIGTLTADGTYLPAPPGSGGGGQPWSYQYGLNRVKGQQWRISEASDGLIVYAQEFAAVYRPVRLYFYDQSEQHLVPDVRYTAKESPQDIATWQLQRLLDFSNSQLTEAWQTEVPPLPTGAHASVTVGASGTMTIELPGSSHLTDENKKLLAAQLIANFADDEPQLTLTITDGGAPIDIPGFPSPITQATVARDAATADLFTKTDPKPVFYLDGNGRLVTGDDGKPVPGLIAESYGLTSVAVAAVNTADDDYYVAATTGTGSNQTLWMGRTQTGLRKTVVPSGLLTRPSWAAGLPEVWVAEGATLYRVDGPRDKFTVPTSLPSGDRIAALRLSPDGSRLAMIVHGPTGSSQLWIGTVARTSPNSVRIISPQPIMPPNYHLSDVAWDDNMTLWVVGTDTSQRNSRGIWSLTVDGANIEAQPTAGLPQGPDSIATGSGVLPWVSAGTYVYKLGAIWEGPNHHTTAGTSPVYLE